MRIEESRTRRLPTGPSLIGTRHADGFGSTLHPRRIDARGPACVFGGWRRDLRCSAHALRLTGGQKMAVEDVLARVAALGVAPRELTGGEPAPEGGHPADGGALDAA
jgi:hypothetical protein